MVKRLIVISLAFSAVTILITLNMHKIDNAVFLIPIAGLIFGGLVMREIYAYMKKEFTQKNSEIHFTQSSTATVENIFKISKQPFLFGLEKKIVSEYEFYFDDHSFYVENKDGRQKKYDLSEIIDFKQTSLSINNRRIWQISLKRINESVLTFRFTSNYTLFNKNFKKFYDILSRVTPSIIKNEWSMRQI